MSTPARRTSIKDKLFLVRALHVRLCHKHLRPSFPDPSRLEDDYQKRPDVVFMPNMYRPITNHVFSPYPQAHPGMMISEPYWINHLYIRSHGSRHQCFVGSRVYNDPYPLRPRFLITPPSPRFPRINLT